MKTQQALGFHRGLLCILGKKYVRDCGALKEVLKSIRYALYFSHARSTKSYRSGYLSAGMTQFAGFICTSDGNSIPLNAQ